jgi:hypothetical protein
MSLFRSVKSANLTAIDHSMFAGLTNLGTIDISYNPIELIGPDAFSRSRALLSRLRDVSTITLYRRMPAALSR